MILNKFEHETKRDRDTQEKQKKTVKSFPLFTYKHFYHPSTWCGAIRVTENNISLLTQYVFV